MDINALVFPTTRESNVLGGGNATEVNTDSCGACSSVNASHAVPNSQLRAKVSDVAKYKERDTHLRLAICNILASTLDIVMSLNPTCTAGIDTLAAYAPNTNTLPTRTNIAQRGRRRRHRRGRGTGSQDGKGEDVRGENAHVARGIYISIVHILREKMSRHGTSDRVMCCL